MQSPDGGSTTSVDRPASGASSNVEQENEAQVATPPGDIIEHIAAQVTDGAALAALSLVDKSTHEMTAKDLEVMKREALEERMKTRWAVQAKADWESRGCQPVTEEYWEGCRDRDKNRNNPVNGHRGVYAYHCDDCWCSMGGWNCNRDGMIWSCCGSTTKDCFCPDAQAVLDQLEKETPQTAAAKKTPAAKKRE